MINIDMHKTMQMIDELKTRLESNCEIDIKVTDCFHKIGVDIIVTYYIDEKDQVSCGTSMAVPSSGTEVLIMLKKVLSDLARKVDGRIIVHELIKIRDVRGILNNTLVKIVHAETKCANYYRWNDNLYKECYHYCDIYVVNQL
jgi:hypothetical protein